MTAHIFVVSAQTFNLHLKYLFVGTGSKDHQIDFNNSSKSKLHFTSESSLAHLLADGSRLRKGDSVFFYVQQDSTSEGKFYGVFECIEDGSFIDNDDNKQFLRNELGKNLNVRALIKMKNVYPLGVSEWKLLDDISNINSPYEMIWSLIYRKLKGNRGNTMITLYEENQLIRKLVEGNKGIKPFSNSSALEYSVSENRIIEGHERSAYIGSKAQINLIPRVKAKFQLGQAFESHLQAVIVGSLLSGSLPTLDSSLFENHILQWIGNEVSCGVGMQRIDILTQTEFAGKIIISPIELKAVSAQNKNLIQIQRYINWLKLYYLPLMPGTIRPVLVTKANDEELDKISDLKNEIKLFNSQNSDCESLIWVTYQFNESELTFIMQDI